MADIVNHTLDLITQSFECCSKSWIRAWGKQTAEQEQEIYGKKAK